MTISSFYSSRTGVAPGTVVAWHGALSDIPDGWALCDGNNGTEDLRNRFVRGASSGTESTTGGTNSYSLSTSQMASHSHNVSTDTVADHNHDITMERDYDNDGGTWDNHTLYYAGGDITLGSSGAHGHNVTTDSTGSGSSINNKPPYYEVAFIQKL